METEKISRRAFDSLPEYSCSVPTGVRIGKVWKRDRNFGKATDEEDWVICEYVDDPVDPEYARIQWRIPKIVG